MSGSGARVSIPNNVRRMIQDIKEITGNHAEEEIYAMLRECSMDPNETTQKLLMQDTFHEVKRKRDRRRENVNRDSVESRPRPGLQGRGSRVGRGSYYSRPLLHDAGGGSNSFSGKENGPSKVSEKGAAPSMVPTVQKTETKNAVASSAAAVTHAEVTAAGSVVQNAHISASRGMNNSEVIIGAGKLDGPLPVSSSIDASKIPDTASGNKEINRQQKSTTVDKSESMTSEPSSGSYFSASDPVLLPSQDSRPASAVGTIRRQAGSQHNAVGPISVKTNDSKLTVATDSGSSNALGKVLSKSQGFGKNQPMESSSVASSIHGSSSVNRPSSNYSNRAQVMGPQKVGPNKEWKPKPTNPSVSKDSGFAASSEAPAVSLKDNRQLQPPSVDRNANEVTLDVQRKLAESHISDGAHVIPNHIHVPEIEKHISDGAHVVIPNHIHVPEIEKLGFCFGSFDNVSFGLTTTNIGGPDSRKSPSPSEASEVIEETTKEHFASNQNPVGTAEEVDFTDHPQSSSQGLEKMPSNESEVSSSVVPEHTDSRQEAAYGGHEDSGVHTSSNYGFGFMQPALGSQSAPFDSSESQARDASRLANFVVQQPFDPATYYAQFYRSVGESDGRISPFLPAGLVKHNGNVMVAPQHTSQSLQEGSNPVAMSTASPTPLVTQAAGLMQSSISVTQPPLPVIRQPTGLHLPHYTPNYIPYGHYFPPFYVPPPAIHQFLSSGAFAQQPQAGSVFAPPPLGAAKYALSQYKPGTITGNTAHIGVPGSYVPYGSSSTNYNTSPAMTAGNSSSNEDLVASQYKENHVLVGGQQGEGSGVWITTAGRDISSLQPSSLYNLPPGQMVFPHTQPGHGSFSGIYHPVQPVSAASVQPLLQQSHTMAGPGDMVGPAGGVYQQSQHSQIHWPGNY